MPKKYTLDTLPRPNDRNIKIRVIPSSRIAAMRFSGSLNEKLVAKKTAELTEWLKKKGITPTSAVASSQYNPIQRP